MQQKVSMVSRVPTHDMALAVGQPLSTPLSKPLLDAAVALALPLSICVPFLMPLLPAVTAWNDYVSLFYRSLFLACLFGCIREDVWGALGRFMSTSDVN